jgi:hypothetical protein
VIAAHPKANRYKTEDFFDDGRKVVLTAQLTKECFFLSLHMTAPQLITLLLLVKFIL